MINWGYRFLERTQEKCHLHHITSRVSCQHDLSLMMLTLITWLRQYLSGFFTVKSLSPPTPLSNYTL